MSFGENVVCFRKKLKITQEELAEKLFVSRQTVSRWENDSFYPDMDTLIKICDMFNCNLDTLIRGNAEENNNCTNSLTVNEYDKHMNKFTYLISIGVWLIIFGVSLLLLLNAFISEIAGVIVLMLSISAAVAMFIIGGISHSDFMKANPHMEPYPENTSQKFIKKFPFFIAGATGLIFVGIITLIIMLYKDDYAPKDFTVDSWSSFAASIFMLFISVSVFLYVYAGMQHSKYNVKEYNEECIKEGYIEPKENSESKKDNTLEDTISGIIMMAATILFLLMGFIGNLWHPCWVVFPIGGILCGIVSSILKAIHKK